MFVTPMIGAMPMDLYNYPKRSSVNRHGSRLSNVSSDASSLYRTSSTTSNGSTSASSVSSTETSTRPQHRRTVSGTSFHMPRAFQPFHKKARSYSQTQPASQSPVQLPVHTKLQKLPPPPPPPQQQQRPRQPPPRPRRPSQEALRLKEPLVNLPTARSTATQWQCSDLVVRCKGDVYHVDSTIVSYHSKWFARICAIMRNPKTSKSVIDLSADDPEAVAAMMQYCYQLDYNSKFTGSTLTLDQVDDLQSHVDVYMLAERYGISGLKELALHKFQDIATTLLTINGNERLLLKAVRAIYEPSRKANADELRQAAIMICADHVEGFISGSHTTMALVFESMDELPEFRNDLFEEMALRWK